MADDKRKTLLQKKGTTMLHSEKVLEVKMKRFEARDSVSMGTHHKTITWFFSIAGVEHTWKVQIDGSKMVFTVDDKVEFPHGGESSSLSRNYEYHKKLRGTLHHIGVEGAYEVKSFSGDDKWHSATLVAARADGQYEALVSIRMPKGEVRTVHYPLVETSNIRDPQTKKVCEAHEIDLKFRVVQSNILFPQLFVDDQSFVEFFYVPSPPKDKPKAIVDLKVNKDRTMVTGSVGHGKLKKLQDSQVTTEAVSLTKLKCEWVIVIGAFGEHHIIAEKKAAKTKEITLTADEKILFYGLPQDLGKDKFKIEFALQGKNVLKFELIGKNKDGSENISFVEEKFPYSHNLCLTVDDVAKLEEAVLVIDGQNVAHLPEYRAPCAEPEINASVETLEQAHGIHVPYAVDDTEGDGFVSELHDTMKDLIGAHHVEKLSWFQQFLGPLFGCKCKEQCGGSKDAETVQVAPGPSKPSTGASKSSNEPARSSPAVAAQTQKTESTNPETAHPPDVSGKTSDV